MLNMFQIVTMRDVLLFSHLQSMSISILIEVLQKDLKPNRLIISLVIAPELRIYFST